MRCQEQNRKVIPAPVSTKGKNNAPALHPPKPPCFLPSPYNLSASWALPCTDGSSRVPQASSSVTTVGLEKVQWIRGDQVLPANIKDFAFVHREFLLPVVTIHFRRPRRGSSASAPAPANPSSFVSRTTVTTSWFVLSPDNTFAPQS